MKEFRTFPDLVEYMKKLATQPVGSVYPAKEASKTKSNKREKQLQVVE